jgi:hypothetical protein
LADQRATRGEYLLCEPEMGRRVDNIHAGPHHSDGETAAIESSAVGGGIDSKCEATDHDYIGFREVRSELLSDRLTIG